MEEAEWLSTTDVAAMLAWVNDFAKSSNPRQERVSDRKLRLAACACVRQFWERLPDQRTRAAGEAAEQFADDQITAETMGTCWEAAWAVVRANPDRRLSLEELFAADTAYSTIHHGAPPGLTYYLNERHIDGVGTDRAQAHRPTFASLLRCIVGNPFRPVTLPTKACGNCDGFGHGHPHRELKRGSQIWDDWECPDCAGNGTLLDPPRLTPTVRMIAQQIYADRSFDLLPVLRDALIDGGCEDEAILAHLREPCPQCRDADFSTGDYGGPIGNRKIARHLNAKCVCKGTRLAPHARGCWCLDLLLGKE